MRLTLLALLLAACGTNVTNVYQVAPDAGAAGAHEGGAGAPGVEAGAGQGGTASAGASGAQTACSDPDGTWRDCTVPGQTNCRQQCLHKKWLGCMCFEEQEGGAGAAGDDAGGGGTSGTGGSAGQTNDAGVDAPAEAGCPVGESVDQYGVCCQTSLLCEVCHTNYNFLKTTSDCGKCGNVCPAGFACNGQCYCTADSQCGFNGYCAAGHCWCQWGTNYNLECPANQICGWKPGNTSASCVTP